MAERQIDPSHSFEVPADRALIGVVMQLHGQDVTRFFADEHEADAALSASAIDDALSLAGAWRDIPWEETEAALERIRHDSPPSAPLEL